MRDHNANSAGVRARRNDRARSVRLWSLPATLLILPARRLALTPTLSPQAGRGSQLVAPADRLALLVFGQFGFAAELDAARLGPARSLFATTRRAAASATRAHVTSSSGSSNSRSGARQKERSMVQPFFS
jgi:hypothetical protein